MHSSPNIFIIGYKPDGFAVHSGMYPTLNKLQVNWIEYSPLYERVLRKSWTAGNILRQWGIRTYGSAWNSFTPWLSEWKIQKRIPKLVSPGIIHFLWGEFGAPHRSSIYHRRKLHIITTVHCSARRWNRVWLQPNGYARSDFVIITSESQRPFVVRHVPQDRIFRILHGVESHYFVPSPKRTPNQKLRLLLLGNTERNHHFAAEIARQLPRERFEYRVRTLSPDKVQYDGIPCVNMLPRLEDAALLEEYQRADILVMPMLDSAANNVLLEAMACGTPVMVNRVGGIPEYVDETTNFVMDNDGDVATWVEKLMALEQDRDALESRRSSVRKSIEHLDNAKIAVQYKDLYQRILENA